MVRLYIIRHADPDYDTNAETGGTITSHGIKEALALKPFLEKEGITHVYSSPLGRALDTAKLATASSGIEIGIESWARELSTWRHSHIPDNNKNGTTKKPPALWDYPGVAIRNELQATVQGVDASCPGWTHVCTQHAPYLDAYQAFCRHADDFLARHGIHKRTSDGSYQISSEDGLRIAVFMHHGSGVTWLSHLLGLPLPLAHAAFWLAPSSVTTILFDENNVGTNIHGNKNDIVLAAPRAICVGGTQHLAMAGLETINSQYEGWKRPSGIKANFW